MLNNIICIEWQKIPTNQRQSLHARRRPLQDLQEELMSRQQEVSSLQEISAQLRLEAAGEDSVEAKEKVHVICNKLRLLLRRVAADRHVLQRRLVNLEGQTLSASALETGDSA